MFQEKLYKVNQKWIWKIAIVFTFTSLKFFLIAEKSLKPPKFI